MSDSMRGYPVDHRPDQRGVVPIHAHDGANMLYPSEIGYYDEPDEGGFDFWGLLRIIMARKWMILAITLVGVATSVALTLRVVPLYTSSATLEVQREEVQIIQGTNVGPEIVADSTYMETQYRLLSSRSLAERVAEELNLANDPRYASPGLPRETRVRQAAGRIVRGLRISPSGNSRVVRVAFVSPYPEEAARIPNAVMDQFIQSNLERKYNTTAFAREFLDERLATTKRALEESERRFVAYADEQGLVDIGGTTNGAGSLNENALVMLNNELSTAESERIRAEQEYRAASNRLPLRQMLESQTLMSLRQTRSTLLSDYEEMLGRFKPDYPDMVQLQTRIDRIELEIAREEDAIANSIVSDLRQNYDASVAREASLQTRVEELRSGLQDERNRRIQYQILQREVETIRSQYEALLQRSKEVSIASGIGSSNISIVDSALIPGRPFRPNLQRSVIQAFILSLALGIGLAFVLNFIDDTIKTPDDLRQKLGIPAIGVVPKLGGRKDLITDELDEPKSAISEAFASARTALEFATESGAPKSLLITSSRPGEGKTSTTIALATIFARGGKSVLIIDGDMRKPSFVVDARKSIGLSGLLTGDDALEDHVVYSKTPGLAILPAGVIPPNPAQLLSGPRLKEVLSIAESMFDLVIIDSPPLLSFTDSPRLGSVADGALLVVQSGLLRTPAAKRSIAQLYESRTNVLGGVLSKFDAKRAGYDYSYYYSAYGGGAYSYVESDSKKDAKRKIRIESALVDDEADETELWA